MTQLATGQRGELRFGHRSVATLGPWAMDLQEDVMPANRSVISAKVTDRNPVYGVHQATHVRVELASGVFWCWPIDAHGLAHSGGAVTVYVTGPPATW